MCATYRMFTDEDDDEIRRIIDEVVKKIGNEAASEIFSKDIYPKGTAPVIQGNNVINTAIWGFPLSESKSVVFNARGESILDKYMFKRHMKAGRCLVPATGFYEWDKRGVKNKRVLFRPSSSGIFYFAGLISNYPELRFTIITTAPNSQIEPIHNRMPVILHGNAVKEWLNPDTEPAYAAQLLIPYTGGLSLTA